MEFKKNKLAIIFLIILLVLGVYLRFTDYNAIGYPNDSLSAVAGGLAWFYPLPYFPGLVYIGPPLGNIIIGAGCMLSGEDFSGVSQAHANFTPDLPILIGQQMVNAEPYCKAPIYLFGLIFFILISSLSVMLFRSYYALFPIAFFTFSQFILEWSRVISVDVISYVFIFLGIIFLWKAYNEDKESKKENLFFILTFISLGFAGATKLTAGIYLFFALIFFVEKYWQETKSLIKKILKVIKINIADKLNVPPETNQISFTKKGITYFILYLFALLIPYKLNPANFFDVFAGYTKMAPNISSVQITTNIFTIMNTFLMRINEIDLLIFLFSIFIFLKILFKKDKEKNEKFILYFVLLFIFTSTFFESTWLLRVAIPLLISIIFLLGLAFSNKEYSIFSVLKIQQEKRKKMFYIFLSIYILFSILVTIPHAPYYFRGNEIICSFEEEECYQLVVGGLYPRAVKPTVNFLSSILNDNETFLYLEAVIIHVYARQNDSLQHLQFANYVQQKAGRSSTIQEKIEFFKPDGRDVRYYIPPRWFAKDYGSYSDIFKEEYVPNYIIRLDDTDVIKIYDLYNLTKKEI